MIILINCISCVYRELDKGVNIMESKTVQVYSEKLGKMVDVDVINKESDDIIRTTSVMLVVDEEE